MIPGAVTISYLYPRETAGPFTDCLMRLACTEWAREHIFGENGGGVVTASSGPLVAAGRNLLVEEFLDNTEGEWMIMLDSDHTFDIDAIRKLVEFGDPLNAPVVGGLCFSAGLSGKISPTMFTIGDDGKGGLTLGTYEKWPEGSIIPVDATGASFLAVHRFLLEDMRNVYKASAPLIWFANGLSKGAQIGEDVFFCQRARNVGAKIFVHTGVEAPHIKQRIVDSTDYFAYRANVELFGEEQIAGQARNKLLGIVKPLQPLREMIRAKVNRQQRRQLERKAS